MIIKIDHLSITSDNLRFNDAIKFFLKIGYRLKFLDKGIKNLNIKRPLMKKVSTRHDLALLTCDDSIDVEIVNYDYINEKDSNIIPVFNNLPKKIEKVHSNAHSRGLNKLVKLRCFYSPVYLKNNGRGFNFSSLVIRTNSIGESIKFWDKFGFKVVKNNGKSAILDFNSPFKNNNYCRIDLRKSGKINKKTFLDDGGFNYIAFVASSARKEKERIEAARIRTTAINSLSVNKKKLDIFFAAGNQGEVVEIIGINQ